MKKLASTVTLTNPDLYSIAISFLETSSFVFIIRIFYLIINSFSVFLIEIRLYFESKDKLLVN